MLKAMAIKRKYGTEREFENNRSKNEHWWGH